MADTQETIVIDDKAATDERANGAPVSVEQQGRKKGLKFERFIFDALPMCERSIVMEVDRVEEFAPIKNATGTDSAESSRALQTLRGARWLESVGVTIPYNDDGTPNCTIEISPQAAMSIMRSMGFVGLSIQSITVAGSIALSISSSRVGGSRRAGGSRGRGGSSTS